MGGCGVGGCVRGDLVIGRALGLAMGGGGVGGDLLLAQALGFAAAICLCVGAILVCVVGAI